MICEFLDREASLFVGFDKWELEKHITAPFFWWSDPFVESRSEGFLSPEIIVKKDFPLQLIVNLDDVGKLEEYHFKMKNIAFFASEWHERASEVAVYASDILYFDGSVVDCVKEHYKMKED